MKKVKVIEFEEFESINFISEQDKELIEAANKAAKKAYAPYSKYHVGAAVRLKNKEIIEGNNQENIAYPSGLCAERVAIFYASAAYPDETMESIAIAAISDNSEISILPFPCGSCRQVLSEYENKQKMPIRVILYAQNGKVIIFKNVQDLIPWAFVF